MATGQAAVWLDRLIWTLIYGGLFTIVIGLASRTRDPSLSWALIIMGACVAAVGCGLVWVRSRLHEDP